MTSTSQERLHTAKHELSHAMVAYALRCQNIVIRVFRRGKKQNVKIAGVGAANEKTIMVEGMGFCSASFLKKHYSIFVSAGPFASPAYRVLDDDLMELQQLVAKYRKMTGMPISTFETFVLSPVRAFLDCDSVISIINRIAPPLAEGGTIKAATHVSLERFFPKDLERPLFNAMVAQLREAADDYPFDKL